MENKAIVIFIITDRNEFHDLEVPLDITANELVIALNAAYHLGIDITDVKNNYLKAESPIVLLKGNRTLKELGIRTGTRIYYSR